jgi:hypothetical protein
MASEPITVFSRHVAPAELLDAVRGQFPDAHVKGTGAAWREITLRFGNGRGGKALTLLHDPNSYTGPNWPEHVRTLQAHVGKFPAGDRQPKVQALVRSFRFSLEARFEPDYDETSGDDRLGILLGVTQLLDGVIYTPTALLDSTGRLIACADGARDEDVHWPDADGGPTAAAAEPAPPVRTPAPAAAKTAAPAPAAVTSPDAPTPGRVARRAVALMAVTARAVIEREVKQIRLTGAQATDMHARLLAWVAEVGLETEFEQPEREVLRVPPGKLADRDFSDALWRVEGLEVLGWALNRSAMPRYDGVSNVDDVWNALGFLDTDVVRKLLAAPTLRPRGDLDAYRRQMTAYHWRLVQFQQTEKVIDFRAVAEGGKFGPVDVDVFGLADGDLTLRGQRIDRVPEEVFADVAGVTHERLIAITWVCQGPAIYSKVEVGA